VLGKVIFFPTGGFDLIGTDCLVRIISTDSNIINDAVDLSMLYMQARPFDLSHPHLLICMAGLWASAEWINRCSNKVQIKMGVPYLPTIMAMMVEYATCNLIINKILAKRVVK
jgi:hypothetical protein